MASNWQWVKPEVSVEEAANGSLFLRNKLPLAPYPDNLATWLRQNAARFPDKPFLKERGQDGAWQGITYAEMLAKTNQISNGLVELDIAPTAPIAILSHNCINMALIQFATMQVGHPVAPISLAYSVRSQTGSLIEYVLDVTEAPVLVISDADLHMPKLKKWDNSQRRLFAFSNSEKHNKVGVFAELFAEQTTLTEVAEARFQAVTPDTLAKIQFTSGSTNLPKGAEITHGMMTCNQVSISQLWPFLGSDEVLVDWLPWNHTFGGNFNTNMVLMHGATMHIDDGNPTPAGLAKSVANIIEVQPTIYFGVPASYAALYSRMQHDTDLRQAFFKRLKFIFVAAAALDQKTYMGIKEMSKQERGQEVPFFSAWGTTETAPCATLVYWLTDDIRVIGLPNPGTTLKLIPASANRYEVRVAGPNISKGYYHNLAATDTVFDEEGFYSTGDAVAFSDPNDPNAGLIFEGRIGEDFKLTSGVWAHNAQLRGSINRFGQPYLIEVVPDAPNKPYLNALVIPNVAALRWKFGEVSAKHPDDSTFLNSEPVVELFRSIFHQHNGGETGSSKRFVRFTILTDPPQFDRGETTDKGYINQRAVLNNHADLVEQLYEESPPPHIIQI